MSLLSIVVKALDALDLDDEVNRFVIDRAVNVCRNRPHPWSTKHDYISWSGLTERPPAAGQAGAGDRSARHVAAAAR
jgi:prostaglandin-endoperoxide synthase 2